MSFKYKFSGSVNVSGLVKLKTAVLELFGWNQVNQNWDEINTNWNDL